MMTLPPDWVTMGEALLIGLIVGVERESDREERHAGLRDFVSIGLAGGLCGLMNQPLITIGALAALTAMLVIFRMQTPGRTGVTTEVVAVVTFLLCVLTATRSIEHGSELAIALTVILALFLDARDALRRFVREVLTEQEYWDTLRYLAVIFVILPVLPDGAYGPYGAFNPRRIWMFVILVSSISYLGYFLQKHLGHKRGLLLTALVGGIGSTTAATLSFAKEVKEEPERAKELAAAAVLANVVQSPRILALLWLSGGPLLGAAWIPFTAMTLAGLGYAWWLSWRSEARGTTAEAVKLGNPFRIGPALKFGAIFVLVRFLARWGTAEFGSAGAMVTSAVGGSVDVDAIAFSLAGMMRDGQLGGMQTVVALLVAVGANGVFKTAAGYVLGSREYGRALLMAFVVMLSVAVAVTLALG